MQISAFFESALPISSFISVNQRSIFSRHLITNMYQYISNILYFVNNNVHDYRSGDNICLASAMSCSWVVVVFHIIYTARVSSTG